MPRMDPSVFLSLTVSVTLSEALFVFLAILFFHDQYILSELFGSRFDLRVARFQQQVGLRCLALCNLQKPVVQILLRTFTVVLDRRNGCCNLAEISQEDLAAFSFLLHPVPPI